MKRILVVDDDSSVLQMLMRALDAYELTLARDGVEALALAKMQPTLDLLITDYLMPEMTGDELIARIREQRPHLKALVITGHGDLLDRESPRLVACGAASEEALPHSGAPRHRRGDHRAKHERPRPGLPSRLRRPASVQQCSRR